MSAPRILIVSALRNEGAYVLDWLAHFRALGATDFLLYTNDCDDGTDDMLDHLARAGLVEHRRHAPASDESVQWHAFRDAWKSDLRKRADWALVCDVDEYPVIKTGDGRFADLLAACPGADAIALPWRLFGSSGQTAPEDRPVTERFTRAASDHLAYPLSARFFKTLMRLGGPFNQFGVHRPSQKAQDKAGLPVWVDGSGLPLPESFAQSAGQMALPAVPVGRDLVQLNHYSVRSAQEFIVKRHRGLPNHRSRQVDIAYWVERNFNTVEDRSALYLAKAAQAEKTKLLAVPGVFDQHARGLAWRAEAFESLMQSEENYALYTRCLLSAGSAEISAAQARDLFARYGALRA